MGAGAAKADEPPLLAGYRPTPGVADELFAEGRRMRPAWRQFIRRFAAMTEAEISDRFARGNQYLRDAGVYFRQYSNAGLAEREWPLAHVPVLLDEGEWDTICDGLAQRAELLETVMADIYGPARLVAEGHLPPELVAGNPQWLRPMVGVEPKGGHHLHFLAFEIGRSPDGSWFVLGDRTQAPSGAGFALENRMATGRIFPEPFPRDHIHRLAGFFIDFRKALERLAVSPEGLPRSGGILTPGPANDSYYEHTYIARYLGLMLLEGEDLLVQNGQAMVRTIEGPQPIGALWRRIDAAFADPLELDPTSRIGAPGLIEAVRSGELGLVNALGSGVIETRALLAFLPRISRVLTGEPLRIPNIATWWCGGARERAYVRDNADRMMIGPAQAVGLPFDLDATTVLGGSFRGRAKRSITDWLESEGGALVGQEAVTLSTTPAWVRVPGGGALRPCPMTVRVFAARTAQGWTFMKGGYARIGPEGDATALTMQQGAAVADVWIIAGKPVPQITLTPQPKGEFRRANERALPARAADNLFWLGRYVERCDGAVRLLRAYHLRVAALGGAEDAQILRLGEFLSALGIDVAEVVPAALIARLDAATQCASRIRDRFSTDAWLALKDLGRTARNMTETAEAGDDAARAMAVLVRKIAGFAGLVHENMHRSSGWRFLTIGRALERADGLAALLGTFADADAPQGSLDLAVEVADSVITHRRRYTVETNRDTVVDLLALDAANPRAILFQLEEAARVAQELPQARPDGRPGPLMRALMTIRTRLTVSDPESVGTAMLKELRAEIARATDFLAEAYLR